MIELVKRFGVMPGAKKKYLIDSTDELPQLESTFGNEAYCITDKKTYVCNGSGVYVEKKTSGGDAPWNWMGKNAVCINPNLYTYSAAFKDTDYATWTPSTTASTIINSTSLTPIDIDMEMYDYLLIWKFDAAFSYLPEIPQLAAFPIRFIEIGYINIFRHMANLDDITNVQFSRNNTSKIELYCLECYSAFGIHIASFQNKVGVYVSTLAQPSFGSLTDTNTTLTVKTPIISAKCEGSFFSQNNAQYVDQTLSTIKYCCDLWRIEKRDATEQRYVELSDLYHNPL